mmetsp:Transcript_1430/g.3049  ORF Transcript_1430/g.3049 Transcript_1430/m.3049 type:complete len:109 (-) Transcript_1430:101-427(-)
MIHLGAIRIDLIRIDSMQLRVWSGCGFRKVLNSKALHAVSDGTEGSVADNPRTMRVVFVKARCVLLLSTCICSQWNRIHQFNNPSIHLSIHSSQRTSSSTIATNGTRC